MLRPHTKTACKWAPVTIAVTRTLGSCLIDENNFNKEARTGGGVEAHKEEPVNTAGGWGINKINRIQIGWRQNKKKY